MTDTNIYLLANYTAHPKDKTMTSKPGYMLDPDNIEYEEHVIVAKGLRKNDMKNNNVIIDLTDEVIVKNSYQSEADFQAIFKHFFDNYGDYIGQSVRDLQGITDDEED
jgi:hypothetical protein